jgi:hypothetical protein
MDADTYPREDVQQFLKDIVCVKVDAEEAGEPEQVAKRFGANSFPRLILVDPLGRRIAEIRGKPAEEQFAASVLYDWRSAMSAATAAGDHKGAAEKILVLRRWFPDRDEGKDAESAYGRLESDEAFKAAWEAEKTRFEEGLAKAKEEGDAAQAVLLKEKAEKETKERKEMLAQAAELAKKSKKKEAGEIWQKIVTQWPDSEEAKTARGRMKFYGVKIVEPDPK